MRLGVSWQQGCGAKSDKVAVVQMHCMLTSVNMHALVLLRFHCEGCLRQKQDAPLIQLHVHVIVLSALCHDRLISNL